MSSLPAMSTTFNPLRIWIHPNVEHWHLTTYKRGELMSSPKDALTTMKKDAKFPTACWNCYLLQDKIPPLWEDKAVKKGGMFSINESLSSSSAECHAQSLKLLEFAMQKKIVFKDGNETDTEFYFAGISFSISRRGVTSPKIWLKDIALYTEAITALEEAFPRYEFSFSTFDIKSNPPVRAATTSKLKMPAATKDTSSQVLTGLLNKLTGDTLVSTIAVIQKMLRNSNTDEFQNIMVQHLYRSSTTSLGVLIDLMTDIDFSHAHIMDGILEKMGTVVIENDDEQTAIKLRQNLSVARSRLLLHMFSMDRISRKDISDHINSVLAAKQLDVVIELLKCLSKSKDGEFLTRIRDNLTAETKKTGKIYYLMLDIFDEIAAQ
jgi:hypothetical protein